jgi:predicted small metal-binding protein
MVHEVICAEAGMDCAFEVRSEDPDELVEIVQFHAQESHNSDIQRVEVEDLMHEA